MFKEGKMYQKVKNHFFLPENNIIQMFYDYRIHNVNTKRFGS